MERVLIVAKTKMNEGVCLGGLVLNTHPHQHQRVRLLPPGRHNSHLMDTPFNLGDIWDLELEDESDKNAPHTEDMRIKGFQRYIQTIPKPELKDFLLNQIRVHALPVHPSELFPVHPSALFNGLIRFTYNRKGFVFPAGGLPGYSTGFWRFNQPLYKYIDEEGGNAVRYLYSDDDIRILDVKHIGFDEPLAIIPKETLLRFSLARGFSDDPQKRCYLQLSGWFL